MGQVVPQTICFGEAVAPYKPVTEKRLAQIDHSCTSPDIFFSFYNFVSLLSDDFCLWSLLVEGIADLEGSHPSLYFTHAIFFFVQQLIFFFKNKQKNLKFFIKHAHLWLPIIIISNSINSNRFGAW